MQQPSEARRCLEHFVTPATTAALNLDTLLLEPNSLLDEEMEEYFSDVVYSCQLSDKQEVKVSFLFEHKSYPDKKILLQVLHYKALQYRKFSSEHPLELIIPVLFVHGKKNFKVHSLPSLFQLPNKHLERFIPQFGYELIDVNAISRETLNGIHATYLFSLMLAFKNQGNKDLLLTNLRELFKFVDVQEDEDLRKSMFKAFLLYIFQAYKLESKDMIVVKQNIPRRVEPEFMTLAKVLRLEGKAEGKIEGKAIEKIKKNLEFTTNLIVDAPDMKDELRAVIAGVKVDFITQVRKTFQQKELKKRQKSFTKFYKKIEELSVDDKKEFDSLFDRLDNKFNPPSITKTNKKA